MSGIRVVVIAVVTCCFFVLGSFSPLLAAGSETMHLIELLKAKKIITQEEADQLISEVNASAQKEEMEKAQAKASSSKEASLPAALRGFKFGTTIYSEWRSRNPDSGSSTNEFNVNRAYLTLTRDINDWLGMNLTADLFKAKDPADSSNGYELRMKYAYGEIKLCGTTTELGLVHTSSDAYDSSIWPYRVQDNHLLDSLGIQSTADFGVVNRGVFGGYMDEDYLRYASKPFAGKWGGYMIGVYNGSGYTKSEANNNKVISGTIYVRPLPRVSVLKGLQLAYTGSIGKSNSTFDPAVAPGANPTEYPDFNANVVQLSLQEPLYTIMGQYYWGDATATSTEENSRKAFLVDAFLRVPRCEKTRIFGKYVFYDPDTDVGNNSEKKYVAGLSYDISSEFMPFFAFEKKNYDSVVAGSDYDQYQLGFQLKF